MNTRRTKGEKIFAVFNVLITGIAALCCLLPFINVLAVSFSSNAQVSSGAVTFWPKDFTLTSYEYLLGKAPFSGAAALYPLLAVLICGTGILSFQKGMKIYAKYGSQRYKNMGHRS